MNKIILLITLSMLYFFMPGLHAQEADGGLPGYFLNLGMGARALAMGRAFVAEADDSNSVYWNPAGLARLKTNEITLSHYNLFEGTGYDCFTYAKPLTDKFSCGMGFIRLYSGKIDETNAANQVTMNTFDEKNTAYFVSGSLLIFKNLYAGASLKSVQKSFYFVTSNWTGADIAVLYDFSEKLSIGINAQNIICTGNSGVPLNIKTGLSYLLLDKKLRLTADTDKTNTRSFKYHTGLEFMLNKYLSLRGGWDDYNISAGFGAKLNNFRIDYAALNHPLAISSRVTLAFEFGNTPKPLKETQVSLEIPKEETIQIKKEKIQDYEIEVNTIKEIPTAIYHLFKEKTISVINLQIKNNSANETRFIVKYGLGAEKYEEIKEINIAGLEKISVNLTPLLTQDEIRRIEVVPTISNVFIEVQKVTGDTARTIYKQYYPVTLLPYDQFIPQLTDAKNETFNLLETLVSWATYNDRSLCEVLTKASDRGALLNPPVKIIGFQAPNVFTRRPFDDRLLEQKEKDYLAQIELLYNTLKDDYKITYLNQPVAYGDSQRIKLPYFVLQNKGNCIELSLLFASLLESIEMDPILVIFPDDKHATVGWKVNGEGRETCAILETNVFGEDFGKVYEKGKLLIEQYGLQAEFTDTVPFDETGTYKKGTSVIIYDLKKLRNRIPPSPYIPR